MPKWLAWLLGLVLVLAITLFVFDRTFLLTEVDGIAADAPTLSCDDRAVAEGFTYHFRDPRRGETVAIHARGTIGGTITPDPDARALGLVLRVAGESGDQVEGRGGRVFVNGTKFDDIETKAFKRVDLSAKEYFVLGDNRSDAKDSRTFGPVPRDAIYGRVIFVAWPLGDLGPLPSRKPGPPPGPGAC
jgi:signal peptidase I